MSAFCPSNFSSQLGFFLFCSKHDVFLLVFASFTLLLLFRLMSAFCSSGVVGSKLILKGNSKGEGTKKSKECQRVVGSGGEWWGIVETGEE